MDCTIFVKIQIDDFIFFDINNDNKIRHQPFVGLIGRREAALFGIHLEFAFCAFWRIFIASSSEERGQKGRCLLGGGAFWKKVPSGRRCLLEESAGPEARARAQQ